MRAGVYHDRTHSSLAAATAERLRAAGYRVYGRSAPDYRSGEVEQWDVLAVPTDGAIAREHREAYPQMRIEYYAEGLTDARRRNRRAKAAEGAACDAAPSAPVGEDDDA